MHQLPQVKKIKTAQDWEEAKKEKQVFHEETRKKIGKDGPYLNWIHNCLVL